jgi:DNA replication protein DnaC
MSQSTETEQWEPIGTSVSQLISRCSAANAPGIPSANTSVAGVCPACDGAGYYKENVPLGHPNFGQLFPCHCKQTELAAKRGGQLARLSNLQAFAAQTFGTFDADVPGVRKAYLRAREYAAQPCGWLLLFGAYGVGKTHLAAAVAHLALQRGEQVLFAVVPDLLDHLRATFGPASEVAYDERFELIRTVPLLVLDDLGTESATAWAREKLYQLINHRYNEQLPTIVTTNRPFDTLDGRIVSRMAQLAFRGEVLQIHADDYRRRAIQGSNQ